MRILTGIPSGKSFNPKNHGLFLPSHIPHPPLGSFFAYFALRGFVQDNSYNILKTKHDDDHANLKITQIKVKNSQVSQGK
jgi:hypothetical protein